MHSGEQQACQDAINRIVSLCQEVDSRSGACETQVRGIPWTEEQFSNPATVKAGLPEALQDTVEFYQCTERHERVEHRASKLGFWLRRLHALKADEAKLKEGMDCDVARVIRQKR